MAQVTQICFFFFLFFVTDTILFPSGLGNDVAEMGISLITAILYFYVSLYRYLIFFFFFLNEIL